MASQELRRSMASSRDSGPVIQGPSPAGRVMRPSRLMPALANTHGKPVVMRLAKGRRISSHSILHTPVVTAGPAARRIGSARPS